MCNPQAAVAGAGIAMSALGGKRKGDQQKKDYAKQERANRDAFDNARAARMAEQKRQLGWDQEGRDTITSNVGRTQTSGTFDANRQGAVADFMAQLTGAGGNADAGPGGTNDTVRQAMNARLNKASSETRQRIGAVARQQSYANAEQKGGNALGALGEDMGRFGDKRAASLAIANQEQSIGPVGVTPSTDILGDVLMGGGQLLAASSGGMFSKGGSTSYAPQQTIRPVARPTY
jgi:hypothetical protein